MEDDISVPSAGEPDGLFSSQRQELSSAQTLASLPLPSPPANTRPTPHLDTHSIQELHERMSSFERATLRWTRITVVVSILALCFVCAQWWEMHTGGQDTHDLAEQAKKQAEETTKLVAEEKKQAETAQGLAKSAASQAKATADLVKDSNEQVKNSKKQADETRNLARNSAAQIDIMAHQLEYSDRPWIKVIEATVTEYKWLMEWHPSQRLNAYLSVAFQTKVKNVGKSAALNVHLDSELYVIGIPKMGDKENDVEHELQSFCSGVVQISNTFLDSADPQPSPLFPDDEEQNHSSNPGKSVVMKPQQYDYDRGVLVFVLGCVSYNFQASTKVHFTQFAYQVQYDQPPDNIPGSDQLLPLGRSHKDWKFKLVALPVLTATD